MADLDLNVGAQIERLVAESLGQTVEIGGVEYATRALHDVRKPEPEPKTIDLSTLRSFAAFVREQTADYAEDRGYFVHVESPTSVRLATGVFGEFNQRVDVARVRRVGQSFRFDAWHDPETFLIGVQTLFTDEGQKADVLKLVGNIQWDANQTTADDGVTQIVSTRVGLSFKEKTSTPNPWMLSAHRTFAEVTQPSAPFILRTRGGGDKPKQVALFEADGGQWALAAVENVRAWLAGELPDVAVYA